MNRVQSSTSQAPKRSAAASKPKPSASSSAAKGQRSGKSSEALLARVEAVRLAQRQEGHFDCFAKAKGGYCDQGGCAYHADCLGISKRLK